MENLGAQGLLEEGQDGLCPWTWSPKGKLWLFQERAGGGSGNHTKLLTCVWDHISARMGEGRGEKLEAALFFPIVLLWTQQDGVWVRDPGRPVPAQAPCHLSRDCCRPALSPVAAGTPEHLLLHLVSHLLLSFHPSAPPGPPWRTRATKSEREAPPSGSRLEWLHMDS